MEIKRENFSQVEIDDSQLRSSSKRKRCPREDCSGYLEYKTNVFVCPECGCVEKVMLDGSHELFSQIQQDHILDEALEKKRKYYVDPTTRRMRGLKLSLKAQVAQLRSRFHVGNHSNIDERVFRLYRALKSKMENVPTWISIIIFYFSFFTHRVPFFICDIVHLFKSGIVDYKSPWRKFFKEFENDVNENFEKFSEVKNVHNKCNKIPDSTIEIWHAGVWHFRDSFQTVLGDGFQIERYVKEFLYRLFSSNSNLFVVYRHFLFHRILEILRRVEWKNPFVEETITYPDESKKVWIIDIPPEVNLISYVLTALVLCFNEESKPLNTLVFLLEKTQEMFYEHVQIPDEGTELATYVELPKKTTRFYYTPVNFRPVEYSNEVVQNLKDCKKTRLDVGESVKKSFVSPLYRRRNYSNFRFLFQDRYLKAWEDDKTEKEEVKDEMKTEENENKEKKVVNFMMKEYDPSNEEQKDILMELEKCRNSEMFHVNDLGNKNNPWGRLFAVIKIMLDVNLRCDVDNIRLHERCKILHEKCVGHVGNQPISTFYDSDLMDLDET